MKSQATLGLSPTGLQQAVGDVVDQILTFSPSETEKCVSFPVADDNITLEAAADTLVFNLSLIDAEPGVELGQFSTVSVVIIDDDG